MPGRCRIAEESLCNHIANLSISFHILKCRRSGMGKWQCQRLGQSEIFDNYAHYICNNSFCCNYITLNKAKLRTPLKGKVLA